MPPKKDIPQGLKDWLAKPENIKKRQEAIAKNKAVKAKKVEAKIVETINMEKGKQYLPKNSSDKKLLALKLSADKAKLPLPNELLNVIKEFTPEVKNDTFPQNENGSYKAKEKYIDLVMFENQISRYLEDDNRARKKFIKLLTPGSNDLGNKQIRFIYMVGKLPFGYRGNTWSFNFLDDGKNLYPFLSTNILTGGREIQFFPLEEVSKTQQGFVKKMLGME
jgi:hypothetical protein